MRIIRVEVDGEQVEVADGSTLGQVIRRTDPRCAVAMIKPVTRETARTSSFRVFSTKGEITIELSGGEGGTFDPAVFSTTRGLQWHDRYAAAFGPFPADFSPQREPSLYERGDVIIGCGGYDPKRSYLLFARMRHSADLGAAKGGGIIGRVVTGKGVLDRWTTGDEITGIEQVVSWADTTRSFTTVDMNHILEDSMEIVTHVTIGAQGFSGKGIDTLAAKSVEHLLLALEKGVFQVNRSGSTHIAYFGMNETDVPEELRLGRREGVVTLRTRGTNRGGVYIYTGDLPASASHTIVGQVTQGIELARLAKEGDFLCTTLQPARFDLVGMMLHTAEQVSADRHIVLVADAREGERVVVDQEPSTTLECLSGGSVKVTTVPLARVIDISLDDANAPASCDVFRKLTGLNLHHVGRLPFFFNFEDVYLFKPEIPRWVKIIPENMPTDIVPPDSLAITNDSRKGAGLVGVRTTEHREFGPTSEPFEGTNLIGKVLHPAKLKTLKEKETVFIREGVK